MSGNVDTGKFKCKNCSHVLNDHVLRTVMRDKLLRFCVVENCSCPEWRDVAKTAMEVKTAGIV